MTRPEMDAAVRDSILEDPDVLLADPAIVRALVAAGGRAMGPNVVDMRGLAMDRLEARLQRLEEAHRGVIAAAYDNIAGTNQIHRAVLRLAQVGSLGALVADLDDGLGAALGVGTVRLVLEGPVGLAQGPTGLAEGPAAGRGLRIEAPGFVHAYLGAGREDARRVTLRRVGPDDPLHDGLARSEACLPVDLGPDRPGGLLALGSASPQQFAPGQGTDLLQFFGAAFERTLRRVLG